MADEKERPHVKALLDKAIGRVVRLHISDGRVYVGRFECVDKIGTVFLQDALEVLDRESEFFYVHHLYESLFKISEGRFVMKFVGSVIVPRKHVAKVLVDNGLSAKVLETLRTR